MSINKKDVKNAAMELNKVLGLDPQINVSLKLDELSELVIQAAGLIEKGDKISKATLATIELLAAEKEENEDIVDEEAEIEEMEAEEEEDEDEDKEKVVPLPKKEDKKEKSSPAPKAPKEEKKEKAEKIPRTTRIFIATQYLKNNSKNAVSIEDLVSKTDEEYMAIYGNGRSNLKESRYSVNKTLEVLSAFGAIEIKNDSVKVIKNG